jgi:PAS domain-containing protein
VDFANWRTLERFATAIFSIYEELEQNELESKQIEEAYRSLIHNIQTAVVVHGAATQIIASNPMAQELLGLTQDQMVGRKASDPEWKFFNDDGSIMSFEQYPVNQVLIHYNLRFMAFR